MKTKYLALLALALPFAPLAGCTGATENSVITTTMTDEEIAAQEEAENAAEEAASTSRADPDAE